MSCARWRSGCPALLWVLALAGGPACGPGESPAEPGPAGGDDGNGDPGEHADEVTLSPEALRAEGIVIERAALRELRPTFRVPARVAFNGDRMAHVGSPVRGRAAELLVKLGDEVEQGAALLVIDSPELGEAQSDYLQKRSAAETAVPAVDLARNAYERGKALHENQQGLALTEVQKREAELRAAQATLRAAETAEQAARNRLLLLGMTEEAAGRLDETSQIDPRITVRAPIAGQVIEREVTLGELVNPEREALLVLADLSHLWILADVPETRLREVAVGAWACVLLGTTEGHECAGQVAWISPAVDPETRTVRVRIEASDRHDELRPGVFAQAEIASTAEEGALQRVLAVPDSALQLVEGQTSIFVPVAGEPGTFARRKVLVGRAVGGFVPLHSGLAEGEEYVARGAFILKAELGKGSAEHDH